MSKLRTVKEVCTLTGLNRKLLFDYKDVIKPSAYSNTGFDGKDGYKLYDESAVIKLRQVAIFRELGMERTDIKKRICDSNYDLNQLLDEQIFLLKEKQKRINDMISVAEQSKFIGLKNDTLSILGVGVDRLARLTEKWQNSEYYHRICYRIENEGIDFGENFESIFEKLLLLNEENYNSVQAMKIIKELFGLIIKQTGFLGVLVVLTLVMSIIGGGELSNIFNSENEVNFTETHAKAILEYFEKDFDIFIDEIINILVDYHDFIGVSFPDAHIEKMVDDVKTVCYQHYGVKTNDEYGAVFEFIIDVLGRHEDYYLEYLISAMKFYSNIHSVNEREELKNE